MREEQPSRERKTTVACKVTPQLKGLEELPPLPFVDKYRIGEYYIRECYDEYYKLVKDMLDKKRKCVTVTGTPGIGKSIFYAYFFQRFRKEMKVNDTWIIAAANIRNELQDAVAFRASYGEGEDLRNENDIIDFIREARGKKKKVLILCDGTPKRFWGWVQMVVLTSPNVRWLKAVRKDNSTLYMPLWTLAELQEATAKLDLKKSYGSAATVKDIEKRYNTFGGVARECFSLTEDEVEKKRSDLTLEIAEISSPRELEMFVNKGEDLTGFYLVVHFVPKINGRRGEPELASQLVVETLAERMLKTGNMDRGGLRTSLKDVRGGAALTEWIAQSGAMSGRA